MIDHLWQSTFFAAAVWLLTLAFRKNRAPVRYGLWLVASLKFLIPFAILFQLGSKVPVVPPSELSFVMEEFTQPFTPMASNSLPITPNYLPLLLSAVWLCGFLTVTSSWIASWRKLRLTVRDATELHLDTNLPVKVMTCSARLEPGVFGILSPVLLLPEGVTNRLSSNQLQAIITHELCHVKRHDNLTAAIHMAVEAVFWFHPLVWFIEQKLIEERERACDEEVLRVTGEPQIYAEGIISVCKFYLESPVVCMSGVTGSNLGTRIEEIMAHRIKPNLNLTKKLLLACAGIAAVTIPILIGTLYIPEVRAQSKPSGSTPLTYAVASIKLSEPGLQNASVGPGPGGGIKIMNKQLKYLVTFAYDVKEFQVFGGPGWSDSERYDIIAKPDSAGATDPMKMNETQRAQFMDQQRERMRNLLAERFQLKLHIEKKPLPVYALILAKGGSKLHETKEDDHTGANMRSGRGSLEGTRVTVQMISSSLSKILGRPVIDRTNLTGKYDFKIGFADFNPSTNPEDSASSESGSIFTALQQKLGLKLEATKAPVDTIVIDHAEKPSAN